MVIESAFRQHTLTELLESSERGPAGLEAKQRKIVHQAPGCLYVLEIHELGRFACRSG